MREITQIEEFYVRGKQVGDKIKSIIKSGKAREIKVIDEQDHVLLDIPSTIDRNFLRPTLDMVKGVIETVKRCKLVIIRKQLLLFNSKQRP